MSQFLDFKLYVKTKDDSQMTEEIRAYIVDDLTEELDKLAVQQVDFENNTCLDTSEYLIYFYSDSRYADEDVLNVVKTTSMLHPELVYRIEVCNANDYNGYWSYNVWKGKEEYLEGRVAYDEPKEVFY